MTAQVRLMTWVMSPCILVTVMNILLSNNLSNHKAVMLHAAHQETVE